MSDVKRYWYMPDIGFAVLDPKYYEDEPGYVAHQDYAKLEAEAQALREEVAALRARVVVPDALLSAFTTAESGNGKYQIVMRFVELKAMQEAHNYLARLNGKAVSEVDILAVVQRVEDLWGAGDSPHAGAMRHALREVKKELRALLGEGKEHE